jgi:hypothetical protein
MTIDLRANISCSLGPIISGNISDDYLQGSGLVKVSGDVELSGIFTPATGTVVTFSYTKSGITRSIPRKLRVLGSFADPFRRITKVSLGCKLTYLSDLKEPIDWTAFDDPENDDYTSADAEIITIPIRASSIMNKCLAELGITASGNPLTNKFSIESFDFSSGYVSILSDLLVSESYCGHLDQNEVLQIFSLDEEGGTGPVINSTKIIDLDATNFGQLPGEAVTVSYSTLRLKRDINIDDDDGNNTTNAVKPEEDTFESVTREEVITYQDFNGTQQFKLYPVFESTKVTTTSRSFTIRILSPLSSGNYYIISGYERVRKVVKRVTEEETSSVTVEGGLVSNYLKNGEYYYPSQVKKTTTETFEYDAYGNEKFYQRVVLGTQAHLVGTFGVQEWCFSSPTGLLSVAPGRGQNTYLELEKRWTKTTNDFQRVRTQTFGPWTSTIAGQQAIAEGFKNISTYLDLLSAISYCSSRGLALIDSRVTSRRISEGEVGPSTEATNNANNADGGDPNNGYRTDSVSELELALGSPTAQRRIEFSLPYAPDDIFIKTADGYTSVPSDAPQKAAKYGRVQNRLLLGNRSGMNLQLEPEIFPTKPFSPIMVQANGLSALYRVNGTNWQLSAEGLLVSTDALFWGAIGGTGGGGTGGGGTGGGGTEDYWFPVAPGVVSLPSTPPVVDGSMTVTTVVPPWNETVVTTGSLRVGLTILSLAYPLELLTEVSLSVRTPLTYNRLQRFIVPSPPGITNASLSPKIDQSLAMRTPGIDISVNANVPQVGSQVGVFVIPPLGDSTVSALAPRITGSLDVRPIAVDFAITANVPVVGRFVGVYIDPGVANTIISGLAPTISGPSAYNLNVYPPATDTIISALLPSVEGTYSLLDLYPSAIDTSIGCLVPVVSAQSEDPYYSSVSLLLHMDGSNNSTTFADSSTNTLAIAANGNAKISTAQSKFGVASAYFDGTGDYLSSNYSTSLDLIGNDFTVECWLYIETIKAVGSRVASCGGGTVAFNSTNGIHWLLDVLPSGVLRLAVRNTSGAGYGEVATSLTISVNTWTHIAACVSGSTGYVSVNGTVVSASLGTLQRPSTDPLLGIATIPGEVGGVTTALQGYIDDLRITKGVARYTSSFIPPTAPFVNVGPI